MKVAVIVGCIVVVATVCAVAGCVMFGKRNTAATIPLSAKPKGKIAIVYYSQSQVQNTALVAKWIQKHIGGDLYPLEMVEPYPDAYGETLKVAGRHHKDGTRPPLKSIPCLDGYDVVFVGSPIWYGTYAPPFATFADAVKLEGKTVVPYCTHGGGGASRFFEDVRKALSASKVLDGLTIRGSNQIERRLGTGVTSHHTEDDVVEWLNRIFGEAEEDQGMNNNIYGLTARGRNGASLDLSTLRGKVLLIVNTATGCGFTPQYEGLEKLYAKYHVKGLEILDFPCDQFGHQAPGSDDEIHQFCALKYNTTFDQLAKVEVNGDGADPVFKFLKASRPKDDAPETEIQKLRDLLAKHGLEGAKTPGDIEWNFTKFLVDREGNVIKRFHPTTTPDAIDAEIEQLL